MSSPKIVRMRVCADNQIVFDNFAEAFHAERASSIRTTAEQNTVSTALTAGARYGRIDEDSTTYLFFSDNADLVSSNSRFKSYCLNLKEVFQSLRTDIENIRSSARLEASRLLHNLESLTGHISQEVYSIASQSNLATLNWKDQISWVEKLVKENPADIAKSLLMIARNNTAIGYEISVHRKLRDPSPILKKDNHSVHKVMMNVLYQFFPDFVDKNVDVIVQPSDYTATFDYESVRVALYHLVQNAAKYMQDGSPLNIRFSEHEDMIRISFDMTSLQVGKDESDKIFEDGFSGHFAKKHKLAGDGQGMLIVRRLASINSGRVSFECANQTTIRDGRPYQNNIFDLFLPRTVSQSAR